jgi:hypothetical protein
MVSISEYKGFWEYLATVVAGIDKVYLVHEESDLPGMIKDADYGAVMLVAIIPSSDLEATSSDDMEDIDSCFVFILKKSDRGNLTHDEFLQELELTQGLISEIRKKMISIASDTDHCLEEGYWSHLMHRLVINGIHTDPEYNLLGCNGWGMHFKLKSTGL